MDLISFAKASKALKHIRGQKSVTAAEETFILDISKDTNFAITTEDVNAKTIEFANVPQDDNTVLTVNVGLTYTSAAAITFPASVVWQNEVIPSFSAGKFYELIFISRDKGVTWRSSAIGWW